MTTTDTQAESKQHLEEENVRLREDLELFNRELIAREQEIDHLQNHLSELLSLLKQLRQEELRSPSWHARSSIRKRFHQVRIDSEQAQQTEQCPVGINQEILPLNVWLVTRDRFVEQTFAQYIRQRDRLLCISNHALVQELITVGIVPDLILTGAYDFGIDDPDHTGFFGFLGQMFSQSSDDFGPHDVSVITLSSNIPEHLPPERTSQNQRTRHQYISKLRGLQITISEVRFFLEMRRCYGDIMEAEVEKKIYAMGDVARSLVEIQFLKKTGLLLIFSDSQPTDVRWALQLLYLEGKLVKTEHTIESVRFRPDEQDAELLGKLFTPSSFDSTHKLHAPHHLFFFPLCRNAVTRAMQQQDLKAAD